MKKIIIIIIALYLVNEIQSQKLIDIYKSGEVRLILDKEYSANTNWDKLFDKYKKGPNSERNALNTKRIIVAEDGSVFMDHKNRHEIWKFDPNGNFVDAFGEKGRLHSQHQMIPSLQTFVENKYFVTTDVNSRIKMFDMSGKYIKSYYVDYMSGSYQYIGDDKILMKGSVLWPKRWRHIVSVLDLNTGKNKVVYGYMDHQEYRSNIHVISKNNMKISFGGLTPKGEQIYLPSKVFFYRKDVVLFSTGEFLVANGGTGNCELYDYMGKKINSFKLPYSPLKVTDEDVLNYYNSVKKRFTKKSKPSKSFPDWYYEEFNKYVEKNKGNLDHYKYISSYHPKLPYFSKLMVDDEDNLLVFTYTRKDDKLENSFNVISYSKNGELIAKSRFVFTDYKLNFIPQTFQFRNGYIYAVCNKEGAEGVPIRLVRFKLQGKANK